MNTKTSLTMTMKDASGQQNISRSLTDINPEATASELTDFAQGLANLTTNTLVNTSKITKEDLSYDYTPTFDLILPLNFVTKVDNWTWNVATSSMPTTTELATDNAVSFTYKINNVEQTGIDLYRKATMTFLPFDDSKNTPWITIGYIGNGQAINGLSLFMFIDTAAETVVGTILKIHFPAMTYNGYSVAASTLTLNFI